MRALAAVVLVAGCSTNELLGMWQELDAPSETEWAWARHTPNGIGIFSEASGEPLHCSDVAGASDPKIEISTAGANPGDVPVIPPPLTPSIPGAVVANLGAVDLSSGPWVRGIVTLDGVKLAVDGSFVAFSASADPLATTCTVCDVPVQPCTCISGTFMNVPYCE